MGEWRTVALRDAGVELIDCVHATPKAADQGYPYIAIPQMKNGRIDFRDARKISHSDFIEWTKKARPQLHDVVLSRRTNPGVTATFGDQCDFALGQNLVLLRADGSSVVPEFLRWLVVGPAWWGQIEKFNNVGAIFDSLKCADVPRFELPIPPKDEQRRISGLLGALDDKIELNRRMNETLEAMARAIFKDWFVTFGPTRAKMEGRTESYLGANGASPTRAYLAPDIWSLFPDRFDDTGKPEGWKSGTVGEHMVNFDSKRIPVSAGDRAKRRGPYPYHGATGVMDYIDGYLFDGIYLLIGEDGSVVKENGLAFTQYVWGKIWVNNHAHVLQGKGLVSTEQLFMYFQHERVTPYITGAVQLKLSQGRMNFMPLVYAGERICQKFSDIVAPLFSRLRANTDENKTLAATRDLLLPKLMSGEIRVLDIEKLVGEST
jgi:type I restriction enzyme S subunit